jgi:hypothetical protein
MADAVSPGRWAQGADEIQTLIERGELELVEPSEEHAELLMAQAGGHLAAAEPLAAVHPPSAFTLLYDAARKAMAAVLARQGIRATAHGGHIAVQDAIEAQLGPNVRVVVRPFRTLRRRRNQSEYPSLDDPPITEDETRDALGDARDIVTAMQQFLPRVGPFR